MFHTVKRFTENSASRVSTKIFFITIVTNKVNSKRFVVVDLRFINPCWHEEIRDLQLCCKWLRYCW